jgi:hypothetical protein
MKKFRCPCCGNLTLEEENMHEICEVCWWEDDDYQRRKPDSDGGANYISLNEARKAFAEGKNILELERVIKEKYFAEVERARKIAESRGEEFIEADADRWLALDPQKN